MLVLADIRRPTQYAILKSWISRISH